MSKLDDQFDAVMETIGDPVRARDEEKLRVIEAELIKKGYSPERAKQLAVWELHVREGGD